MEPLVLLVFIAFSDRLLSLRGLPTTLDQLFVGAMFLLVLHSLHLRRKSHAAHVSAFTVRSDRIAPRRVP